jgi:hypothetical protein
VKPDASWQSQRLAPRDHEVFTILFPDSRHRLIDCLEIFRGTIDPGAVVENKRLGHVLRIAQVVQAKRDDRAVSVPSTAHRASGLRIPRQKIAGLKTQRELGPEDLRVGRLGQERWFEIPIRRPDTATRTGTAQVPGQRRRSTGLEDPAVEPARGASTSINQVNPDHIGYATAATVRQGPNRGEGIIFNRGRSIVSPWRGGGGLRG